VAEAVLPQPVGPRRALAARFVAVAMVTFLALAVLKPWTWGERPAAMAAPSASPSVTSVPLDATLLGVLPAAQPIDFDWGRAATALADRDAWGVATLVDSGLHAHDLTADAPPGHVELAVQSWQEVSRTTLGLDARARHGPWIVHPPALVWPADDRSIIALALTAPEGEPPAGLRLWASDEVGDRRELRLRELGTGRPGVRLLLAASPDPVRDEAAWEPGTYRLEMMVGGQAASLTIEVLDAPPLG
jgi:hypothetical protein